MEELNVQHTSMKSVFGAGLNELRDNLVYTVRWVWDFLLTYLIGVIAVPLQFLDRHRKPTDLLRRDGQIAILTGGTRGIGLEVARQLMDLGMRVVIGCRNPERDQKLMETLMKEHPNGKVEACKLDLTSLKSVREFAQEFLNRGLPLHLLVNNAGIMFSPFALTEDGFESHLGVNYLGHFLLTHLLLQKLRTTGTSDFPARVINVSSCVNYIGNIKFDDLQSKEYYSPHGCYSQSKLAQILFTCSLQQRLSAESAPVYTNAVHPGVVFTELYQFVSWVNYFPVIAKFLFKTPVQGAETVIHCVSSKSLEHVGGKYIENSQICSPNRKAHDPLTQKQLWEESCRLVGIDPTW